MSAELIKVTGGFSLAPIPQEVTEQIDNALAKAALVPDEIDNEQEQAIAVEAQRAVAALVKSIEKARKEAKDPAIEFGRAVDARAKQLVAELEPEQLRIAKAVGNYQQALLEKAREEARRRAEAEAELERQRQAEIERIRNEQEAIASEARRKAAEEAAEARRKASEELAKARSAKEAEEAKRRAEAAAAQAEINRLKMEEELKLKEEAALQVAAERAKQEAEMLPKVTEIAKADGQSVREVWDFTVTDIWTLARLHPGLVEIKERRKEILEVLALGHKVSGVNAFKVVKSSVRTSKQQVIEV